MPGIQEYIRDKEFKIIILDKKINIVNYIDLLEMKDNSIVISSDIGKIIIKGFNLSIKKLLNKEILVIGEINSILIGEDYA